jgi:LPXTG-motif cell wall-anchored protein
MVNDRGEVYYQVVPVHTLTLSAANDFSDIAKNLPSPDETWKYALREVVPPGYLASYDRETVTMTMDGETFFQGVLVEDFTTGVVITNYPAGRLPATGGGGTALYTIGGLGLMLLALLLYSFCVKRRREDPNLP